MELDHSNGCANGGPAQEPDRDFLEKFAERIAYAPLDQKLIATRELSLAATRFVSLSANLPSTNVMEAITNLAFDITIPADKREVFIDAMISFGRVYAREGNLFLQDIYAHLIDAAADRLDDPERGEGVLRRAASLGVFFDGPLIELNTEEYNRCLQRHLPLDARGYVRRVTPAGTSLTYVDDMIFGPLKLHGRAVSGTPDKGFERSSAPHKTTGYEIELPETVEIRGQKVASIIAFEPDRDAIREAIRNTSERADSARSAATSLLRWFENGSASVHLVRAA